MLSIGEGLQYYGVVVAAVALWGIWQARSAPATSSIQQSRNVGY